MPGHWAAGPEGPVLVVTVVVGVAVAAAAAVWFRRRAGDASAAGKVQCLHRYAVKGLWFDSLPAVRLQPQGAFPGDRAWALITGEQCENFNADEPQWLHKSNFHCAFSAGEALAKVRTAYEDTTTRLTVCDAEGQLVVEGRLADAGERALVEAFFRGLVGDPALRLVSATQRDNHQFNNTNAGKKVLHLVNLETVRQVSEAVGCPLNPLRFRANVLFDGVPAWTEFGWVGKEIDVKGVRLKVLRRTVRCDAIKIDLATATVDLDLPRLLEKHFPEHGAYLGVYAEVVRGGTVRPGDPIRAV